MSTDILDEEFHLPDLAPLHRDDLLGELARPAGSLFPQNVETTPRREIDCARFDRSDPQSLSDHRPPG